MITIITPTYNRGYCLKAAYESLVRQTINDFEWIIVDDGSNDNTRCLVESWLNDTVFKITYIYKQNGGKHTALNVGIDLAKGELVLILDSDDYLSEDAIEKIIFEWQDVKFNSEVGGLHFLRGYQRSGKCIGMPFVNDHEIASTIKVHYRDGVTGDKCKIYRSEILKQNQFPVFEGESLIGEAVVWNKIAKKYKVKNINTIVYLCEYLLDGLTANRVILSLRNPRGGAAHANERVSFEFPLHIRFKSMISYIVKLFNLKPLKLIILESNCKWLCVLLLPVGMMYYYLNIFFKKNYLKFKF
jgi:glycosyltransferase involved in cell wall biosynthesis